MDDGVEDSQDSFGSPDSIVRAMLPGLKKEYSDVPYFTKLDDQYLFYVVKGNWIDTNAKNFAVGHYKLGLLNEKKEVLLKAEYNKIYNPDGTARGYIEFEKNGKRGLVNYHTKKIISPEYDVIFPYNNWEAIAVGRIARKFYKIYSDGRKEQLIFGKYDGWRDLLKQVIVNKNTNLHLIYDLNVKVVRDEEYSIAKGVVVTPSFLYDLKFDEKYIGVEFFDNVFESIYELEFNFNFYYGRKSDINSFISTFIERGVSGRDYVNRKDRIVVTDSVGDNRDVMEIDRSVSVIEDYFYIYSLENNCDFNTDFYRVFHQNDSIVRVNCIRDSMNGNPNYSYATYNVFYKIDKQGFIEKIESNRLYDITKFMEMHESDFDGDFIIDLNANSDTNGIHYSHLRLVDLELMRNEIFADYGYKFKNEKWKKYFSAKYWYKAEYDNIDRFLSPIDKHNIEFIKKKEQELLKNENLITKPTYVNYGYGY